ncbi:IscS subfamily cysteine desulfurase [Agriterribacter sp.]|uniref:IscS subfamily cysteine desulfurase n=1 Tax=Agriterribacter sp. TaxID=2821509 RepID=UPI002BD6FDB4|nr:IscS subfamily cysteine desulfurase [Agriterribacter sp.]HRO46652.1 IscS subfamily cysteine desulfurase [Agriterribacter sp.]HRQ17313.1 IscS subfamily cysteine desulfurase [Agriterribacter sp.]
MLKLPIYLDNNATTPVDPQVLQAMLPYFTEHFGNAASRSHSFGWTAGEAVTQAREQVAQLINADPSEIVFTSGATEAINLAMKGVYEMYSTKGNHIITCVTEHKAVLDTCKHLEKLGAEVTYLQVNREGIMDLDLLKAAIRPNTILISIMAANNETGVLQPVKEIGAIAKTYGIIFFTDATQAVGKIPVDVIDDNIDMLCLSAHKIYGPKGAGALYVRRKDPRVRLVAQIDGGGHEKGMRSGTLNVPGIVALGKCCALCIQQMEEEAHRIGALRDQLEKGLTQMKNVTVNGSIIHRLPNVTNLAFAGMPGDKLLTSINRTIAVSSGSACTSANPEPSHVLKAMKLDDELAKSSIRFGLGRFTTREEIEYAIDAAWETLFPAPGTGSGK